MLELIKKGADVNIANAVSKVTPLHLAVKYADFVTVKVLLNNGADLDARDNMNRNCLVNATERGNQAICRLLVGVRSDEERRTAGAKRQQHTISITNNFPLVASLITGGFGPEGEAGGLLP